jgi:hypothetical protein
LVLKLPNQRFGLRTQLLAYHPHYQSPSPTKKNIRFGLEILHDFQKLVVDMRLILKLQLDLFQKVERTLKLFRLLYRWVRPDTVTGTRVCHHYGWAWRRWNLWVLHALKKYNTTSTEQHGTYVLVSMCIDNKPIKIIIILVRCNDVAMGWKSEWR